MFEQILNLVIITFLPFLELRASIPLGILKFQISWIIVFLVCVTANIILALLVYFFLDQVIHFLLANKTLDRLYSRYVEKMQKKIKPYVEKYGEIGVAIFIGIPLPGSGVYSGMLAAYLLGMGYKKSFYAAVIGVLIAGTAVTLVSVFGAGAWFFFLNMNG